MLAVDDSAHSMNAMRYAAEMSSHIKDLYFVLFHVQPAISQWVKLPDHFKYGFYHDP